MSRIHDLDWCYSNENQLTSCSHDGSVKFWNISSPREPFNTIKAGGQKLWRAKNYVCKQKAVQYIQVTKLRFISFSPPSPSFLSLFHTSNCPQPVGKAVALLLVPAMHSGDSRVFLWGQSNVSSPVHILSGHSEAILDLQWLNSEKLATWSKDRTLRIWGISKQLKSSLGGQDSRELTASLDDSSPQASVVEPSIDLSLEDSSEPTIPHGMNEKFDPSMSLPILRTPVDSHSAGSPSTQSLTSLSSQLDPQTSLFQSVGSQSLAQEFAQLRGEDIPNLEIERVSVCG